ncbi:Nn.00g014820.m01.CDS01 [Neocucurbitaria sp. VM-36]
MQHSVGIFCKKELVSSESLARSPSNISEISITKFVVQYSIGEIFDRKTLCIHELSCPLTVPSELQDYTVAFNTFQSQWIVIKKAPFRASNIPPRLYLDRVNPMLKLIDRMKGGFIAMNKGLFAHTNHKIRTLEAVMQHDDDKHTPIGTPEEGRALRVEQRMDVAALYRMASLIKEKVPDTDTAINTSEAYAVPAADQRP